MSEYLVGCEHQTDTIVTPEMTADRYGNPGLAVLATPRLVELFERAAVEAVEDSLAPGERTVGTAIAISHLAPTPVGVHVRVSARVTSQDGITLHFEVEAHDEAERIAIGTHERVVIDEARFLRRVERKAR